MTGRCQHCGTRNGPAVQVCRHCGEPLGGEVSVPFTNAVALDRPVPVAVFALATGRRRGVTTGLRVGLLLIALGAGAWWWAVRPSIAVVLSGVAMPGAPAEAAAAEPAVRSEPAQAPPVAAAGDDALATGGVAESARTPESTPIKGAKSRNTAAEFARAQAAREQWAEEQAQTDAARRRAEEATRAPPPVSALPALAMEPAPALPPKPVTAQELCASGNALSRGICLARTCIGPAHADEAACQQLRAADDQRRH